MFGRKILILVPHPDDEVVACAATMGRAQAEGAAISALYLTHGCIAAEILWPWQRKYYEKYVARRRAEAEEAAQFLGIAPVGWSTRPARHLWRELSAVYDEISKVIAVRGIDQLWVPAYEGGNADHDGLNAIGSLFKNEVSVLEFAEYNFSNGATHSQMFPSAKGSEQILVLTPAEQKKKRVALALYASEKSNLNYVKTERECFRPLAAYDYSSRPHPGTLWYERFQWVPFRHPRVDFTKAEEVSRAIAAFLNAKASAPPAPATPVIPARKEASRGSGG
jgi:LmbE family N-acetylglucosaminyl deacetylase